MPLVDDRLKAAMARRGVSTLHVGGWELPDDTVFEPPCSIKWMSVHHSLHMGAFSYAVSGYYFAAKIARYTSIGEAVQIGRGSHPVSWATTSPIMYQDYRAVTDLEWAPANNFRANAPLIGIKHTVIGNDVYIGHGAIIMQGVNIGDGAVVGAGAIVTKDVPPYAVVAGSPASVKRFRFSEDNIRQLEGLRWWNYAFWDFSGAPISNVEAFIDFAKSKIEHDRLTPYTPEYVTIRELTD